MNEKEMSADLLLITSHCELKRLIDILKALISEVPGRTANKTRTPSIDDKTRAMMADVNLDDPSDENLFS